MHGLKIVSALISAGIFFYLGWSLLRFKKELREATHEDRSISARYKQRWDKRFIRERILIIIGTIFAILAAVLS
ncbi:hypothetical protein V7161_05240 [Neobacillus drentensis]|uniref:hypothetical protein n=1 Tax=Neobacillus drentensis TaxID=220684 RepID=UPI003000AC4E